MDRIEAMAALSAWTSEQWGLVTCAQAVRDGVTPGLLAELVQSQMLHLVAEEVYLACAAPPPPHLELASAWLQLQPATPAWQRQSLSASGGIVALTSACELLGLGDAPSADATFLFPCGDDAREHQAADLTPAEITLVCGLPVTTPLRTLLDLMRVGLDGGHVGGVLADALQRGALVGQVRELSNRCRSYVEGYGLAPSTDGGTLLKHFLVQAGRTEQASSI